MSPASSSLLARAGLRCSSAHRCDERILDRDPHLRFNPLSAIEFARPCERPLSVALELPYPD